MSIKVAQTAIAREQWTVWVRGAGGGTFGLLLKLGKTGQYHSRHLAWDAPAADVQTAVRALVEETGVPGWEREAAHVTVADGTPNTLWGIPDVEHSYVITFGAAPRQQRRLSVITADLQPYAGDHANAQFAIRNKRVWTHKTEWPQNTMEGSFTLNVAGHDAQVPLNIQDMSAVGCAKLPPPGATGPEIWRTGRDYTRWPGVGLDHHITAALKAAGVDANVQVDVGPTPNADGCEWTLQFFEPQGVVAVSLTSNDITERNPKPWRAALVTDVQLGVVLAGSSTDWWYSHLPAEFLRLPHAAAAADANGRRAEPVQVEVNGLVSSFFPPDYLDRQTLFVVFPRTVPDAAAISGATFTFDPAFDATISAVSPTHGTAGDVLTITGSNFINADPADVRVLVGGVVCGGVQQVSSTELSCTVGPGTGGAADVAVVLGAQGSATMAAAFTHDVDATAVAPAALSPFGAMVSVTGTGFGSSAVASTEAAALTAITITVGDGARACTVARVSYTEVTCKLADGDISLAGTSVDVTVAVGGESATLAGGLTYSASAPQITDLSTDTGLVAAANVLSASLADEFELTISGTALGGGGAGGAPTVQLVDATGQSFPVSIAYGTTPSSTAVVVKVPVGYPAAGDFEIRLTAPGVGFATPGWTLRREWEVSGVSPAQGSLKGGTVVTVTGKGLKTTMGGLAMDPEVVIGPPTEPGVTCEFIAVNDAGTELTCRVVTNHPAIDSTVSTEVANEVTVYVNRVYIYTALPCVAASAADCQFTFAGAATPAVTGVSPSSGGTGTTMTLTGSGWPEGTAGVSVLFGTVPCTPTSVTATEIQCTMGGGGCAGEMRGALKVAVDSLGAGTVCNASPTACAFVFDLAVTSVSPTSGALSGFTPLTIQGSGLCDSTAVLVGGSVCHNVVASADSTSLTCETTSREAGLVELRAPHCASSSSCAELGWDGYETGLDGNSFIGRSISSSDVFAGKWRSSDSNNGDSGATAAANLYSGAIKLAGVCSEDSRYHSHQNYVGNAAATELPDGCRNDLTFDAAVAECEGVGARLCTLGELSLGHGYDMYCHTQDKLLAWALDTCDSPAAGHWALNFRGADNTMGTSDDKTTACLADAATQDSAGTKTALVCCADVEKAGPQMPSCATIGDAGSTAAPPLAATLADAYTYDAAQTVISQAGMEYSDPVAHIQYNKIFSFEDSTLQGMSTSAGDVGTQPVLYSVAAVTVNTVTGGGGSYLIRTDCNAATGLCGDESATGTVRSSRFTLEDIPISWEWGGSGGYVALLCDSWACGLTGGPGADATLVATPPVDATDTMTSGGFTAAQLAAFVGHHLRLIIVDDATDGHIAVDNIRRQYSHNAIGYYLGGETVLLRLREYHVLHWNKQCGSPHTPLGHFDGCVNDASTACMGKTDACAKACRETSNCQYFSYGKNGDVQGHCVFEDTPDECEASISGSMSAANTVAVDASTADSFYNGWQVEVTGGTTTGTTILTGYNGSTREVSPAIADSSDATWYTLTKYTFTGTMSSANTLAASASASGGAYDGWQVEVTGGTTTGSTILTGYNGSTREVSPAIADSSDATEYTLTKLTDTNWNFYALDEIRPGGALPAAPLKAYIPYGDGQGNRFEWELESCVVEEGAISERLRCVIPQSGGPGAMNWFAVVVQGADGGFVASASNQGNYHMALHVDDCEPDCIEAGSGLEGPSHGAAPAAIQLSAAGGLITLSGRNFPLSKDWITIDVGDNGLYPCRLLSSSTSTATCEVGPFFSIATASVLGPSTLPATLEFDTSNNGDIAVQTGNDWGRLTDGQTTTGHMWNERLCTQRLSYVSTQWHDWDALPDRSLFWAADIGTRSTPMTLLPTKIRIFTAGSGVANFWGNQGPEVLRGHRFLASHDALDHDVVRAQITTGTLTANGWTELYVFGGATGPALTLGWNEGEIPRDWEWATLDATSTYRSFVFVGPPIPLQTGSPWACTIASELELEGFLMPADATLGDAAPMDFEVRVPPAPGTATPREGDLPNNQQGLLTVHFDPALTPIVTSLSPSSGTAGGGTSITISGSGFGSDAGGDLCGLRRRGVRRAERQRRRDRAAVRHGGAAGGPKRGVAWHRDRGERRGRRRCAVPPLPVHRQLERGAELERRHSPRRGRRADHSRRPQHLARRVAAATLLHARAGRAAHRRQRGHRAHGWHALRPGWLPGGRQRGRAAPA